MFILSEKKNISIIYDIIFMIWFIETHFEELLLKKKPRNIIKFVVN